MVDDRIEEGLSEEDAVAQIGSVDEVVSQILSDTSIVKLVKEKISPKRKMRAWEIILLILGSPVWLSILIALFAVVFCAYLGGNLVGAVSATKQSLPVPIKS